MVVSVSKAPTNSKARGTSFQVKHGIEYDLKVGFRDAKGTVDSIQWQFCRFRRREEVPGAKRKRTQNINLFAQPYRMNKYQYHHK